MLYPSCSSNPFIKLICLLVLAILVELGSEKSKLEEENSSIKKSNGSRHISVHNACNFSGIGRTEILSQKISSIYLVLVDLMAFFGLPTQLFKKAQAH